MWSDATLQELMGHRPGSNVTDTFYVHATEVNRISALALLERRKPKTDRSPHLKCGTTRFFRRTLLPENALTPLLLRGCERATLSQARRSARVTDPSS